MGAYCSARQDGGWAALVLGFNNGHLLPAVMPLAHCQPEECSTSRVLESAKATGFRPCRRCNPDGPSIECENAGLVAKACRIIEESQEEPSLEDLAKSTGRCPSYFHRMFKATTGVTPKEYAAARRPKKVRQGLASGNSVTEAIYDAGFNSSGRFYEKSTDMLGMTVAIPRRRYQRGDKVRRWADLSRRHPGRFQHQGRCGNLVGKRP